MYVPEVFRESRIDVLHGAMREIAAATLVGPLEAGLIATHVPVELSAEPAPWGRLRCHLARANPHAARIHSGTEVLLIFQGPQGYVSPSWYASKQETGKAVPTWNYIAIHAYGRVTPIEDPVRLRRHLEALTAQFEHSFESPWHPSDAPDGYIDSMCQGIIGLEITLSRIEGKWKLSQNKPSRDREGVVRGLRLGGDEASRELADLVEDAS